MLLLGVIATGYHPQQAAFQQWLLRSDATASKIALDAADGVRGLFATAPIAAGAQIRMSIHPRPESAHSQIVQQRRRFPFLSAACGCSR